MIGESEMDCKLRIYDETGCHECMSKNQNKEQDAMKNKNFCPKSYFTATLNTMQCCYAIFTLTLTENSLFWDVSSFNSPKSFILTVGSLASDVNIERYQNKPFYESKLNKSSN